MTTSSDRDEGNRLTTNRQLMHYLVLPTLFLTVVLLGGLRIEAGSHALVFVAPPLITLILAVMLMSIFVRGRMIALGAWLSSVQPAVRTVAHSLTLLALFFASAQAFNSVLPEAGLFRLLFAFFFLWTLWQSQFAAADAHRTLRSIAALFGTAFVLKHLLLASLNDPQGGWLRRLAAALLEGVTQGTVGEQAAFAPSTGYISFFALALYVAGLALTPAVPDVRAMMGDERPRLSEGERDPLLREELKVQQMDE